MVCTTNTAQVQLYFSVLLLFFNSAHNIVNAAIKLHYGTVITFYLRSCLGQETAKGPYQSSSQAASYPSVYHTRWMLYSVFLYC